MTLYGSTARQRHAPATDRGTDWRDLGLCRNSDPDTWHAVGRDPSSTTATEIAKRVCAACPSRVPCAQWAIDRGEQGVWGGLDDTDRRALKKREERARAKARASA